jgi:hypothetical protein
MTKEALGVARHVRILVMALVPMLLSGCKEESLTPLNDHYARLERVPQEKLRALSLKRVFFGHKSVGQNIIEGLQDVMRTTPLVRLDIRETASAGDFDRPIFAHVMIGKNKNPSSKIMAFREILDGGVGQVADIAFFKFCFVDIDHTSDLGAIYKEYDETITYLTGKYPKLKIITVTVPLLSHPVDIKTKLKKLLGRLPWDELDNIRRNEYNEMLRAKYGDSLFDLAKIESTTLLGKKAGFTKKGRSYDLLNRSYTNDGGHLNALGRQVAAIDLLLYLLSLESN